MQNHSDQLAHTMRNGTDSFIVLQAEHETTIVKGFCGALRDEWRHANYARGRQDRDGPQRRAGILGFMPAPSIVKVTELKKPGQVSDVMLVLAGVSAKARVQVTTFMTEALLKHFPQDKAIALATTLRDGRFTTTTPLPWGLRNDFVCQSRKQCRWKFIS